jgi:hypothetical protein
MTHLDADEVAGVVDLFGALTREEVCRALEELAFKRGDDPEEVDADAALDDAVESYHLVEVESDPPTYAVGPVAFPTLPTGAEDLPHILDVETRPVDRESVARDVEERLRAETARAVAAEDEERIAHLLDVTYDLEAWAAVDVSGVRDRLDTVDND